MYMMEACLWGFYGGWIFELQWGPLMVIFHHGDAAEDKGKRGERRRHPLRNKPWKKELHHQDEPWIRSLERMLQWRKKEMCR